MFHDTPCTDAKRVSQAKMTLTPQQQVPPTMPPGQSGELRIQQTKTAPVILKAPSPTRDIPAGQTTK